MTDRTVAPFDFAQGRVLVWRALVCAARTPAVWSAMGVQIAFFLLYVLNWGAGIPLVGARSVLEQFATAQWILLGVSLSWTATRSGAAGTRDGVAQLAALAGVPPSAIVTASVTALAGLLLALALVGLPFALLARQISAMPLLELWRTQVPLYALSLYAAAVTTACMLVVANRLTAWMTASALTIAAMVAVPPGFAGAAVLATLGAVVTAMLVSGADRRFWYLSEHA